MSLDAADGRLAEVVDGETLGAAGALATRIGLLIAAVALPLAAAASAVVILTAPSVSAGVEAVIAAATNPPAGGWGFAALLYLGVLGVLVGTWYLGVGALLRVLDR